MKLKTFKIWLFLLPLIAVIGVVLFLQSTNNQKELEGQLIRSITATRNDAIRALDDYYAQVDSYFLRLGYSYYHEDTVMRREAKKIVSVFKRSDPSFSNLTLSRQGEESNLTLTKTGLRKKGYALQLTESQRSDFQNDSVQRGLKINKSFSSASNDQPYVDLEIPFEILLRKQQSNRQFSSLLLVDSSGNAVYPEEWKGVKVLQPKPIVSDTTGTRSGVYVEQIDFSNQRYRSYVAPLNLEGLELYAVGMFEENIFQKVGLRINFLMLATLIFFLIILVAIIPILSILNLSKGDTLSQLKVINVGISLLGLALLLGFASSFFRNLPNATETVTPTINEMASLFAKGISNQKILLATKTKDTNKIPPGENINEFLLVTSCQNDNPVHLIEKLVFAGTSIEPVDFSDTDGTKSFIDISDRAYANYFSSTNHGDEYYFGAHYSRGTGNLEAVMSKKGQVGYLNAITFGLQKIDPALNPQSGEDYISDDYRFLLFKEDGKILYKSDKIDIPISYLDEGLSGDMWTKISSLIKSNPDLKEDQSLETSLYLNGYQYSGVLRQIEREGFDQKIWMLFLVNENLTHVLSSLTSLESISLMVIYFLFLIVLMLVQRLSSQTLSEKGFKVFLYNWLKPTDQNGPKLIFLFGSMLILGGVFVGVFYGIDMNHLGFLIFCCFMAVCVSLLNYLVNVINDDTTFSNFLKGLIHEYLPVLLMAVILCILGAIAIFMFEASFIPFALIFLLSFLLAFVWAISNKQFQGYKVKGTEILPAFLCIWFIVIGFFPGYMIQSKTQLFESAIWNQTKVSENSGSPDSVKINPTFVSFEKGRRQSMNQVTDLFDGKIQAFVAPNTMNFYRTLSAGIKPNLTVNTLWVLLGIFGAGIAFSYFITTIQNSIFYRFGPRFKNQNQFLKKPFSFVSCLDSSLIESKITDAVEVDMLFDPELSQLKNIRWNSTYHIKNFHTQKDYGASLPLIQEIRQEFISKNSRLVISSGLSWKELFSLIPDNRTKVAFSEVFADFYFDFIPLKPENTPLNESLSNEDLLQKLRKRKSFYANIWSELNFDERLACYSFAMEGFFNPAQSDTLSSLNQKGVVIPKTDSSQENTAKDTWTEWQLFSPMFRKFILSHVTEKEAEEFKKFEKRFGNSSLIQISIVSFVLICFALIGIFDRNFFNEAYAYLTGSLGLLGSVYALLNRGLSGIKFGKSES